MLQSVGAAKSQQLKQWSSNYIYIYIIRDIYISVSREYLYNCTYICIHIRTYIYTHIYTIHIVQKIGLLRILCACEVFHHRKGKIMVQWISHIHGTQLQWSAIYSQSCFNQTPLGLFEAVERLYHLI